MLLYIRIANPESVSCNLVRSLVGYSALTDQVRLSYSVDVQAQE